MLGDQIDHQDSVDDNERTKEVDEHGFAGQLGVLLAGHGEKRLLGDAHESGGAAHDKYDNAPKFVMRQVPAAQAIAQLGKQERHKSAHPLQAEEDHCRQANPRVQRVHVGYGLDLFVVRVEGGLERDRCEHEHGHLDRAVQDFHVQLGCGAQETID